MTSDVHSPATIEGRSRSTLDPLDKALIAAYAAHPTDPDDGRRLNALSALGITPTRAYQRLLGLLDAPEAWEHDPVTMGLIRRRVDRRKWRRSRAA